MKSNGMVTSARWRVTRTGSRAVYPVTRHPSRACRAEASERRLVTRSAFTLVEVLVVMTLLSLIVLSLMMVLNNTQTAFRAGISQTGVLESGRAVTDLIKSDLEGMTPSLGTSNAIVGNTYTNPPVNFYAAVTTFASPPSPLFQSLVGVSNPNIQRTNVLESFFILSSANVNGSPSWIGTGYAVTTNSPDGALYPLYRFSMTTNAMNGVACQSGLYNAFVSIPFTNSSVWSHLMDGVVELRVRAYDPNGMWMTTNVYVFGQTTTNNNVCFLPTIWGETGFYMFSNTVPASVEIEMGVLEDRTLQRAESLSGSYLAQTNYLAGHAGQVHIFRQRAWIRNVDPSAYQ
jgi:prepilin-type N-terminal cleavage/methylation domain-containing protein